MTFVLIGKDHALEGPRLKIEHIHSQVPIYITGPKGYVYVSKFLASDFDIFFQTGVKNEHFRATNICTIYFTSMKTLDSTYKSMKHILI